ncbi:MAG: phosphohistidine phosphatase [Arcobacteraceae bacterium]|jgi:phosphohistidine phosphatase
MKKLVIIRHAKSDWDDSSLNDFDRPLNKKGLKDALSMGKFLKEKNLLPDFMISSPATRAITTAQIIAKEVQYEKAITPNQYIYEAYVNTLQEIVSYIHDSNDVVFLVGHNPGVSSLSYMLSVMKESIPTAALVEIDFNCDSWMDISKENSTLISYDFPKKI